MDINVVNFNKGHTCNNTQYWYFHDSNNNPNLLQIHVVANYRPVPIIDTREYGIISRERVVGIRPFNFRLTHCCIKELIFSIFNGKTAWYAAWFAKNRHQLDLPCIRTSKSHGSSPDRSSGGQQHLPAALPVFLWPVLMKIHPTESAEVLLLAVGVDYSSQDSVI